MNVYALNDSWSFRKLFGHTLEEAPHISCADFSAYTVSLPHTWYSDEDQYRGLCVYEKSIPRPVGKVQLLSFAAADQNCAVYVNGYYAGSHRGGYSRFRLPIPDEALHEEALHIQVFLENRLNEDICPSFGDFTVFGGLYRGAELLVCSKDHFDYCFYGTDGLIARASLRDDGVGMLELEPHVCTEKTNAVLDYTLYGPDGKLAAASTAQVGEITRLQVAHPLVWDGQQNANLYTLRAALQVDGINADETQLRLGFRQIRINPDKGLFLNGGHVALHGVAKHQDRAKTYCARSEAQVQEDFTIITEMGANAVRLSHYQHPQGAYDCCDELGLLVWAEIPMLKMTQSADLMENAEQQLTELILQNIHHPSIFCWGIQNEIAIFKDAAYMHENCRKLHELAKALDPDRASTAANLYPLKASSKLNEITDLVGYNLYFGWYYGKMNDYGTYLDMLHAKRPLLPLGISEYGVDANLALHSEAPKVNDYSEEFQTLFHETVYPQIESRPWLWGSFVWNMFDFSSARRNEGGQRFLNAKGLVSHDRAIRKDAFFYYKAKWSEEPFVHICSKRFMKRAQERIAVKVYTNQSTVELTINGTVTLTQTVENGTALFLDVSLSMGENHILAKAGAYRDDCVFSRVEEPEPSYTLSDLGGSTVRNWFLEGDDITKEGYFSLNDTANDLLANTETRRVLERTIPGLVKIMVEKDLIPLGMTLKHLLSLSRNSGEVDLKALNSLLNQIPNTEG